jgi:hypothetical protein
VGAGTAWPSSRASDAAGGFFLRRTRSIVVGIGNRVVPLRQGKEERLRLALT